MCDACIEWDGKTWHKKPGGSYYQTRLLLHREVWAAAKGPIPPNHHIHHIDGDIHNNRIENLQLLSSSEHNRIHCREKLAPHQARATAGSILATARNRALRVATRELRCCVCGGSYRSGARRPSAYCSERCIDQARNIKFSGENRMCQQCGGPFVAIKRAQRYCGRSCNQQAAAARSGTLERRGVVCGHCGGSFVSLRTNARFCSRKCAVDFHGKNRIRRSLKSANPRIRSPD